nr:AlNc14C396G11334 [Albugo laibachii Nc14]|eukprot:CCA26633.1 AlNc14C396G11334 [Albugo laibachii Nc14]
MKRTAFSFGSPHVARKQKPCRLLYHITILKCVVATIFQRNMHNILISLDDTTVTSVKVFGLHITRSRLTNQKSEGKELSLNLNEDLLNASFAEVGQVQRNCETR